MFKVRHSTISISGTIVGFGITEATDKPSPLSSWKALYPAVVPDDVCHGKIHNINPASTFCALDSHSESMKICEGDLGSALSISHRGVWVLVSLHFDFVFRKKIVPHHTTSFIRLV